MWVEKKGKNLRAITRYTDPMTGKVKRISIAIEKDTAKARKAAEMILDQKIYDLTHIDETHSVTLYELIDLYLKDRERFLKASSCRTIEMKSRKILRAIDGNIMVDKLNAGYVRKKFIEHNLENYDIKAFKTIINWAYRNDYVSDRQWLDKLKDVKKERSVNVEDQYLEQDEINEVLIRITNESWENLARFLLLTGMRVGEALGLNIDDVNLRSREINVSKTWDDINKIHSTTKTKAGTRVVYIQDELYPLCQKIKKKAMEDRLIYGCDALFQKNGSQLRSVSFHSYLKRHTADMNKNIHPHMFRHTYISLMAAQGFTLEEIARRVGHENSNITKNVYFHVTKQLEKTDREHIKNVKIL